MRSEPVRYRLAACCPRCRRVPSGQFYPGVIEWAKQMPADDPFQTVACTRAECRTIYLIAFVALQHARPIRCPDESPLPRAA